jgi:hypothetical protein
MVESADDWAETRSRSWTSLPAWSPEADPFKVSAALLLHVNVHIAAINQLNLRVLYATTEKKRVDNDLLCRAEAKHGIDDLLSAMDYCAFAVYESKYCPYAGSPQPHADVGRHRRIYFPYPLKGEGQAGFLTRASKTSSPGFVRFFAPYFFSPRHPQAGWLRLAHELGTESRHRMLSLTHVGRLGYGFRGTDYTLTMFLVLARRGAGRILREAKRRV